ncbi:family 1 polysaccharide lyase [Cryphonectria parasitica EP155]|uniref:Family 1 polysaccharide lyase n=1 Tax=Cryphonectria parasitica (strain ATCC 38755 / EP155) TaxID=660469 RepID=A0A9P4XXC2_CRYP1|nr:family 1 polysaccharide lyase [Cryphonectria parasitica EP155]KAF3762596.1 family 1 polysaccharide lyase [Cryphonectria parasitica EP155]
MRGLLLQLLLGIPAVLACTDPDSDPCASYISANAATASPFCATFTESTVTATAGLPAWASNCSNKPSAISKECSCYFTGTGVVTTSSSATKTSATTSVSITTSTGPATTATGTCGAANVDALVGYAAGTTGGGSGEGTTVTTCAELEAAVAVGGVIKISGILDGCDIIDLGSDTTVLGVGSQSGMTNGGFRVKEQSNVILRNLYMHDAPESMDLIELQYSTYVWVDHCDLSSEGLTGDKDYYDGLLDITHATDFVTASWNKFHDHWKGSLIGHSDSNAAEDTGHLRVTYHHNYWSDVNSRLPSIRFGTGHFYSSCFENNPTSGINSRMGAEVLVEENYFLNTQLAIVTDLDSDEDGYAVDRNNIFVNSTEEITQVGSLTPPYSYTLDPASCICDLVTAYAGTGVVG